MTSRALILAAVSLAAFGVGWVVLDGFGPSSRLASPSVPVFVDTRPLPQSSRTAAVVEARPKEDGSQPQQAVIEAEAKRRAEGERLRRDADADVRRRAEDETRRLAAEAESTRVAADAEARRKSDEERQRLAAEVDAKRRSEDEARHLAVKEEIRRKGEEADQVRLAAETKRLADAESRRLAAEATLQAEAERKRVAAEAQAISRADDDARARLAAEAEAETKRRADNDARRRSAEAEAERRAETEIKRLAAAAELQRQVEERKRAVALGAAVAATLPHALRSTDASCLAPAIAASYLSGGRARIDGGTACLAGTAVSINYGDISLTRQFDADGRIAVDLDLLGTGPPEVVLKFADGTVQRLPVPAAELAADRIQTTKVAVFWRQPIELGLHALENTTSLGAAAGHVWTGAPSSYADADAARKADGRGHGFLSAPAPAPNGSVRVLVYTLLHAEKQSSGVVPMRLEYVTRGEQPAGEMCGSGRLAQVPYDVVIQRSDGSIQRESNIIPAARCGETLSLSQRLIEGAVPDIRLRR